MRYSALFCGFSLSCFLTGTGFAEGQWPELDLANADSTKSLPSKTVKIDRDPVYKASKEYQAYPLIDILKKIRIPESLNTDDLLIVFTAVDGYKVSMAYQDAHLEAGYVAFKDNAAAGHKSWLDFKVGKQTMTPAPFYLVWPKNGLDEWRYPWPFQLASITLQPAKIYFGDAAPSGGDESVNNGFKLFSRYCIRCHSVNLSGGDVGPELNVPKNISEYFKEEALPGFILNATAYRAGTKMPAFDNLISDDEARAIASYLMHMKLEKKN